MKFVYIVLICAPVIVNGMQPTKESPKKWEMAKKEIETCIAFDKAGTIEPFLKEWGPQICQQDKNKFLLDCYARPNVTPLILALGADPNVHLDCGCQRCALSGFPNDCKKNLFSIMQPNGAIHL